MPPGAYPVGVNELFLCLFTIGCFRVNFNTKEKPLSVAYQTFIRGGKLGSKQLNIFAVQSKTFGVFWLGYFLITQVTKLKPVEIETAKAPHFCVFIILYSNFGST